MAAIFMGMCDESGRVYAVAGPATGNNYFRGLRLNALGNAFSVASLGTPAYWIGGIPVNADGEICTGASVTNHFGPGAIGIDANGRIVVNNANDTYLHGVGQNGATGSITGTTPP